MKKIVAALSVGLCSLYLHASCESFSLVGVGSMQQSQNYKNTLVWQKKNGEYTLERVESFVPKNFVCKGIDGFALLSEQQKTHKEKSADTRSYALKKGWNRLVAPKDGLDVESSFGADAKVEFVFVYDEFTQNWAGYSSDRALMEKILAARLFELKSIESAQAFYVYAKEAHDIAIQSIEIAPSCKEKMRDARYSVLTSSVFDDEMHYNKTKDMGAQTRYKPTSALGLYADTRVLFIYEELSPKSPKMRRYGPAKPKLKLHFAKEYEESTFYVFDYMTRECYEGLFPSPRIPPFPMLKKLK